MVNAVRTKSPQGQYSQPPHKPSLSIKSTPTTAVVHVEFVHEGVEHARLSLQTVATSGYGNERPCQ